MGLEKIEFFWYVKKISPLALIGYVAGAMTYTVLRALSDSGAFATSPRCRTGHAPHA